jgi:isoleucyl-tRNA synthetase
VAQAVTALPADALRALDAGGSVDVTVDGETFAVGPEEVTLLRRASGALVVQEAAGRFAAVDPAITPELRREGIARELVSRVQRMRKEIGLEVSDRIRLQVGGDAEVLEALGEHRDAVAAEVLARELVIGETTETGRYATRLVDLDGLTVRLALKKD